MEVLKALGEGDWYNNGSRPCFGIYRGQRGKRLLAFGIVIGPAGNALRTFIDVACFGQVEMNVRCKILLRKK